MPHLPASGALSHIRVLDLSRVRAGPACARQLADWGADVIKIELPERAEPDGSLGASRNSSDFQNLQRNKRSMTLNLRKDEGREIFLKLVGTADVVIENFRPDVKDRLGIGYEALKAVNPRIVLGSISGFGQNGPYAKRPGFDQIAQGMGGLMSITGEEDGEPLRVGIPIADLSAGLFCAMGILTALIEREKSGEGQWVTTSLLQAQIFMLDFQAARWLMDGELAAAAGNAHPTSVPTDKFDTTDGAINIGVAGNVTWERLARALGREDWLAKPEYADNEKRMQHRTQLTTEIAKIIATNSSGYWVDRLAEAGVPCGPVNTIAEVFEDAQVKHLGAARTIETQPFGKTRMLAQPVGLSRTPSSFAASPPGRGDHTEEILAELGIGRDQQAALRKDGIL